MNPVRFIAITIAVMTGAVTLPVFSADAVVAKSCPVPTGDQRVGAHPVRGEFRTIQAAARSAGVSMTSDHQVVAVFVYPTLVEMRVAGSGCRMIGAIATTTGSTPNATGRAPFVWSPPLPAKFNGARFVTSSSGSITVELRTTTNVKWRRYVVTSGSMRWTSGS